MEDRNCTIIAQWVLRRLWLCNSYRRSIAVALLLVYPELSCQHIVR